MRRAHAYNLQVRVETMLPMRSSSCMDLAARYACCQCGRVDDCVGCETPGVIFTTFGDAMRVPGSKKNLLQAKAGA